MIPNSAEEVHLYVPRPHYTDGFVVAKGFSEQPFCTASSTTPLAVAIMALYPRATATMALSATATITEVY